MSYHNLPGVIPEQFAEWLSLAMKDGLPRKVGTVAALIADIAYRQGADDQMDECETWLPSDLTIDGQSVREACRPETVDRSDAADARRFRWLLQGNGYYMEENMLCGHGPCDEDEQDGARGEVDAMMALPD